ncbi:MAG: hypothetical protein EXX96DRAFT_64600 [Benjaminiella poitrasii]|nr:MAG: hypothetical protein EXX96DRAFT_64600 [Benjaminiella poitrasii]
MQRLWHRLTTMPSRSQCIYCHVVSRNTFLLPSLLMKGTSAAQIQQHRLFIGFSSSPPIDESKEARTIDRRMTRTRDNRAVILADFYRSLSTQDIDRIWPLYSHLYDNDMLGYLTKKNFYDLFTYIIRSRASRRNLHRLLAVVEDMRQRRVPLWSIHYAALMDWTGGKTVPEKRGYHLTEALRWFDEMQHSGGRDEDSDEKMEPLKPTVAIYNTLIHIAADLKDLRMAQKLYHDMNSKGLRPDRYTCSILLHAMGQLGDVEGMEHMLKEIRRQGLDDATQNTAVWNVMMSGYVRNGLDDRAQDIFRQMVDAHAKCKYKKKKKKKRKTKSKAPRADDESFRIHIGSLVAHDRQREALEAFDSMKALAIKPNIAIYNTLFRSFMNPNHDEAVVGLETLKRIYQDMKSSQVKANSETMYTLVSAFLDLGDTKSGLEAFVDLSNQHVAKDEKALNIQTTSVATLAKVRVRTNKKSDPSKVEPNAELLERLNHIVVNNSQI